MHTIETRANYVGKIVLVGRGRVGKSTYSKKFVDGKFETDYTMTIGTSHAVKTVEVPAFQKSIKFTIWDLAGQRRFRTLVPTYAKGAQAVLYFCSLQDPRDELLDLTAKEREHFRGEEVDSIKEIEHWAPIVERVAPDAIKVLVATKFDLLENGRQVIQIKKIMKQSKNTFGFGGTELTTKEAFGMRMKIALQERVFDFYPYEINDVDFKAMNPQDEFEIPLLRFPIYFISSKTGYNVARVMDDIAWKMVERNEREKKVSF